MTMSGRVIHDETPPLAGQRKACSGYAGVVAVEECTFELFWLATIVPLLLWSCFRLLLARCEGNGDNMLPDMAAVAQS